MTEWQDPQNPIPAVQIVRTYSLEPEGTFGVIHFNGVPFALTLEPPWRGNQKDVSCIPAGWYELVRHQSPKFGGCFKIQNPPPGRTDILIHRGNIVDDTLGCIILGEQFEPWGAKGYRASVRQSGQAFREFEKLMEGHPKAWLQITQAGVTL